MINNDSGQNVIEYILLVAAALLVFLAILNPYGPFGQQIENSVFNTTIYHLNSLNDVQF